MADDINNENEEVEDQESTEGAEDVSLSNLIKKHNLQDELNTLMADNRRKLTKQNTDLIKQLEGFKNAANTTQQQRDELQARIEQLEVQHMSKEELAKREKQKEQRKYKEDVTRLEKDLEGWRDLYTTSTIERSLQDAAITGEAVQPGQLVEILKNKTKLSEVLDEGQPTGKYAPVVKFADMNEEGKPVMLELSPADAIKRMKEMPEHHNLFKGTASGGLGETGGAHSPGGTPSIDILKDPAKYVEWRKKNPDLDISGFRR